MDVRRTVNNIFGKDLYFRVKGTQESKGALKFGLRPEPEPLGTIYAEFHSKGFLRTGGLKDGRTYKMVNRKAALFKIVGL